MEKTVTEWQILFSMTSGLENFYTEDEAVQFVKDSNSGVPKDLMTLDAINDFCMSKALEILWYYRETIINPVCPPRTTKLIECLIEAVKRR